VKSKNPSGQGKECWGGRAESVTTTTDLMMSSMSGRLSLCAGVKAPVRVEPSSKAARRRARKQ